jgi:hypothetical protein
MIVQILKSAVDEHQEVEVLANHYKINRQKKNFSNYLLR